MPALSFYEAILTGLCQDKLFGLLPCKLILFWVWLLLFWNTGTMTSLLPPWLGDLMASMKSGFGMVPALCQCPGRPGVGAREWSKLVREGWAPWGPQGLRGWGVHFLLCCWNLGLPYRTQEGQHSEEGWADIQWIHTCLAIPVVKILKYFHPHWQPFAGVGCFPDTWGALASSWANTP